jgi:hypothetical protein
MKRAVVALAIVVASVAAAVAWLIGTNSAPIAGEATWDAAATTPIVVKLHARWCPVCMATKDVWTSVTAEYGGRVRFVVFDFTTEGTVSASRARARTAGLEAVFDEYNGETGTVLVVDGASRDVKFRLHGDRTIAHYREAIDASLVRP